MARLAAHDYFAGHPARDDVIRFVSVMARATRTAPGAPLELPATGRWMVRVLARKGRFIVGLHRREMPAIRHLGTLDKVFGTPVTTRNWNIIASVVKAIQN